MNPSPTLPIANSGTALQWLTAWVAILLLVVLLARSSWGKPLVYYALWLAVVFLALTHASDIATLWNPAQLAAAQQQQGGTTTNG